MQFTDLQADDFLDNERLERLDQPTEQATTLPNAAYTDPRFLELERRKLFARTWMMAGFEAQIPTPGDVVPTTIAGMPVLLLRDGDGQIQAFHNVADIAVRPSLMPLVRGRPAWCARITRGPMISTEGYARARISRVPDATVPTKSIGPVPDWCRCALGFGTASSLSISTDKRPPLMNTCSSLIDWWVNAICPR